MVVTVVVVLLFLLLLGIMLVPLELCIDTTTNNYYLRIGAIAKASVEQDPKEIIRIRLKALFRNFYFYPLRGEKKDSVKKIKRKKMKKRKKKIPFKKIFRVLKSFKVKKLRVDVDTGNNITNAKLYPVFAFLNYHVGRFHINFEGRTQMVLLLQNRPIYILKSFINT